jgi:hypothetical protein
MTRAVLRVVRAVLRAVQVTWVHRTQWGVRVVPQAVPVTWGLPTVQAVGAGPASRVALVVSAVRAVAEGRAR